MRWRGGIAKPLLRLSSRRQCRNNWRQRLSRSSRDEKKTKVGNRADG